MINVYHTPYIRAHLQTRHAEQLTSSQPSAKKRILRPYTLPYPTLPYPTLTRPKSYSVWGQIIQQGLGREAQWKGKQRESSSSFHHLFFSTLAPRRFGQLRQLCSLFCTRGLFTVAQPLIQLPSFRLCRSQQYAECFLQMNLTT